MSRRSLRLGAAAALLLSGASCASAPAAPLRAPARTEPAAAPPPAPVPSAFAIPPARPPGGPAARDLSGTYLRLRKQIAEQDRMLEELLTEEVIASTPDSEETEQKEN